MPTVRENLIAAKALIDTPEKWDMRGQSIIQVFRDLNDAEFGKVKAALTVAAGLRFQNQLIPSLFGKPHADIMALFDRAISQEKPNG